MSNIRAEQLADAPVGSLICPYGATLWVKVSRSAFVSLLDGSHVGLFTREGDPTGAFGQGVELVDTVTIPPLATVPMLGAALRDTLDALVRLFSHETRRGIRLEGAVEELGSPERGCWPGMLVRNPGTMPWLHGTVVEVGHHSQPSMYGVWQWDSRWYRVIGSDYRPHDHPVRVLTMPSQVVRIEPEPNEGLAVAKMRTSIHSLMQTLRGEYSWCDQSLWTAQSLDGES